MPTDLNATHCDLTLPLVPVGLVRERIRHARNLAPGASTRLAVAALGNGFDYPQRTPCHWHCGVLRAT
jgi:hypothetical protein